MARCFELGVQPGERGFKRCLSLCCGQDGPRVAGPFSPVLPRLYQGRVTARFGMYLTHMDQQAAVEQASRIAGPLSAWRRGPRQLCDRQVAEVPRGIEKPESVIRKSGKLPRFAGLRHAQQRRPERRMDE